MNWSVVARMLGLLALLVGSSMLFSLPWAFPAFGQVTEFEAAGFWGMVGAIAVSLVVGGILWMIGRGSKTSAVLRKEAMATVGLGWVLAGILGALPFLFSGAQRAPGISMTPIDAFFESLSGFTTTGASVLKELEDPTIVARSVLFWRSFTHWLGGMGIIVLFVAILGQLGAGGKAMLKREVPGPLTESVRPRVRETALTMWTIYVVLTAFQTIILELCGVPLYDSLCHAFGTLATGGFSTYNNSAAHFNGGPVEATVVVFMVLAGTNFSLFDMLWRRERQRTAWGRLKLMSEDPEFRAYLSLLGIATLAIGLSLWWHQIYPGLGLAIRHGLFASVSIMTTTGFGTEDFTHWTEFAKGLLFLLMFVGGSAGSTGGGIKVIRCVLLLKILRIEIERAFRPNVVRPLRLGGAVISDQIRQDVGIYFCLIMLIFAFGWLTLIAIEPDDQWSGQLGNSTAEKLLDCGTAVAATLNNIGPGLGVIGPAGNYGEFSQQGKLLLTVLMLLGRLELFVVLVLFFPRFWRLQ